MKLFTSAAWEVGSGWNMRRDSSSVGGVRISLAVWMAGAAVKRNVEEKATVAMPRNIRNDRIGLLLGGCEGGSVLVCAVDFNVSRGVRLE